MRVQVAESFVESVARLEGRDAAAVKRAAFDFLTLPQYGGLHLHRLVHAVDRGFWSLRAGRDLRVIVHRSGADVVLCYADHHDRAYDWAAQRVGPPPGGGAVTERLEWSGPPREAGASASVEAGPDVALPPRPVVRALGSRDDERIRRRALAPLPARCREGVPRRAPPPLVELLRFARQAGPAPGPDRRDGAPAGAAAVAVAAPPREVAVPASLLLAVAAALLACTAAAGQGALAAASVAALALLLGVAALRWREVRRTAMARAELRRLSASLRAGRLDARADQDHVPRALRTIVEEANAAVEAAAAPAVALGAAVTALARGEPPTGLDALPDGVDGPRAALDLLARFLVLGPGEIRELTERYSRFTSRTAASEAPGSGTRTVRPPENPRAR